MWPGTLLCGIKLCCCCSSAILDRPWQHTLALSLWGRREVRTIIVELAVERVKLPSCVHRRRVGVSRRFEGRPRRAGRAETSPSHYGCSPRNPATKLIITERGREREREENLKERKSKIPYQKESPTHAKGCAANTRSFPAASTPLAPRPASGLLWGHPRSTHHREFSRKYKVLPYFLLGLIC